MSCLRSFLYILFVCFSFQVSAQDIHKLNHTVENLDAEKLVLYKALADELRCPTCTGLSVLQSDAPFSVEIKTALVEQVQSGKKEPEILNFFKERFGLWILRTPPREGFHWFAWYVPIAFVLLGALTVWFVFWRRRLQPESLGLRSNDEILKEMEEHLETLRKNLC